MAPQNLVKGRL